MAKGKKGKSTIEGKKSEFLGLETEKKKTNAFEKLPSRIRYYLLDYKDTNLSEVLKRYGKGSLREFNKVELTTLYNSCINNDKQYFIENFIKI